MKKIIAAVTLVAALVCAPTFAQEGRGGPKATPAERAQKLTDMMTKQLSLTAAQVPQVQAINLKYADQLNEVREQPKGEKGAKHEAVKDLVAKKDAEIKAVLTADQFTAYGKWQEEMKQRRKDKKMQKGEGKH